MKSLIVLTLSGLALLTIVIVCRVKSTDKQTDQDQTEYSTDSPEPEELWIRRFKGLEIYHISKAEWNLYRDKEDGRMNLWISLNCDKAIKQFEDTEYTNTVPHWELNLIEENINLAERFTASIPEAYDESRGGWITNMYVGSHQGTSKNTITIIKIEENRILIRLHGKTTDPNYYDGSKDKSILSVETWFTKNPKGKRSMN